MNIGIDGRLWYETGVGRYIRNLVRELSLLDNKNIYTLFLTKKAYDACVLPNNRWRKRLADVRWHTVKEQIVLPFIFAREHLDILHVPYFSVPILYSGKFVETVHDLTHLHIRTGRATTLPLWLYSMKRFAYSLIFVSGLRRAEKIFAVSETTKKDILANYGVDENKIIVTYEGVEKIEGKGKKGRLVDGGYFLYVGNAYPHKNLGKLLEAFDILKKDAVFDNYKLVFVGKDDHFTKILKSDVQKYKSHTSVIFYGEVTDEELAILYRDALAFVFPSKFEGFGLPAVEAVAYGCPVVCSDIPIFQEILGDRALYFNPDNAPDIANVMKKVSVASKKPVPFIDSRFSWKTMAEKTLRAYENCIRI